MEIHEFAIQFTATMDSRLPFVSLLVLLLFGSLFAFGQETRVAPSPLAATLRQPPAQTRPQDPGNDSQKPASDFSAATQNPKSVANTDMYIPTIIHTVDEVSVVFTVTDKHGRFIRNLKQNDFNVEDDTRPPEAIRSFTSHSDLPLRVGLLIDSSDSIRSRFNFEQTAAAEFLAQILRSKSDEAFVLGFNSTSQVMTDFTANAEELTRGIQRLLPGGGTALYDAIYFACRDQLMKRAEKLPARKAIILISDGEDNQSQITREEAIEIAQRAETIIYAISTNVSGTVLRGDKILERIAEATGGQAFFPLKVQDVSNAFKKIEEELRSQYLISYKPTDFQRNGKYRSIQIAAKDKNYTVRARQGYYAQSRELTPTANFTNP